MHLVGFTIEVYYDVRPYERQIQNGYQSRSIPRGFLLFRTQSGESDVRNVKSSRLITPTFAPLLQCLGNSPWIP